MTKKELVNLKAMSLSQMIISGLFVLLDGSFWRATIKKIHDENGGTYIVYGTPNSKVFLIYGLNGVKAVFSSAVGQIKTAFTAKEFALAYPLYKGICESIATVPFETLLQSVKAVDKPHEVLSTIELRLISKYNQSQFKAIAAANAVTVKETAAAVVANANGKLEKIAAQRVSQNARKRALRAAASKEASKTASKEASKTASKEASKTASKEASKTASKTASKEASKEASKTASKTASKKK